MAALPTVALGGVDMPWTTSVMGDLQLVASRIGMFVRAAMVLLLCGVVSTALFLLSPTPDPFVGTLVYLAVLIAAAGIAPVRRRLLAWILGSVPTQQVRH
jgi:hypothetical protein